MLILRLKQLIDWMFVPCLSLISISSYAVQGTKETGNIDYTLKEDHNFKIQGRGEVGGGLN